MDFESIYHEYFGSVYKFALSLCRNASTAEDITQETFYKAMENMDRYEDNGRLFVWLCQIAKNIYFSLYKKQKRFISESEFDLSSQADLGFEDEYFDKETSKKLHLLLHELNEPYKEVFTLRVFGELPFSQIGELFGKTDSWARLIFYRAKIQLRKGLDEHIV